MTDATLLNGADTAEEAADLDEAPEQAPDAPPLPPSDELVLLDPKALILRFDDQRLTLRQGDDEPREVRLARLYPLSRPEQWISLSLPAGGELGVIEDLSHLDPDSLTAARAALDQRYLVPLIRRVLACRQQFDLLEWQVETDRGATTFVTRNARENVQRPYPGRIALTDVGGNRFDIVDVEALDAASRRLVEDNV